VSQKTNRDSGLKKTLRRVFRIPFWGKNGELESNTVHGGKLGVKE